MAQTHSLDLELSSGQYAYHADTALFDQTGDITIELWVQFESTPGIMGLVGKYLETGSQRSFLLYTDSTNIVFLVSSNGSSSTEKSVALNPVAGVWYHVAAAYDASAGQVEFYINGRLASTQTGLPTSIHSGTAQFSIGAYNGDSNHFDGKLKDVRLFSDVRTAAEVAADAHTEDVSDANLIAEYNFNNAATDSSGNGLNLTLDGSPSYSTDIPWTKPTGVDGSYLETNCQGYWTFNESSGNAADSSANAYTLTNTNTVTYVSGKIQNCADLEKSSSQYFTAADPANLNFSNDMTLACWVNFESTPANGDASPIMARRQGAGNNRSYDFGIRNDSNVLKLEFIAWSAGSGTPESNFLNAWTPSLSTWYHVAVTKKGTAVTMYVDGKQLAAVNTATGSTVYGGTAPFTVGTTGDIESFFDGKIDEAGAWNAALTYGGILDLYNGGTGISWTGGTTYDQTYTETLTLVDTLNKATTRVLSDAMTLVDTVVKATTRTLSDAMTLVDTFTGAKIIDTILTETLIITDSITRSITRTLSDAMTLVDTISRQLTRTLSDVMTLVDTVTFQSSRGIVLTETLSLTDTIRKVLNGSSTIWTKTAAAAAATWTKITKAGQ